MVINKLQFNNIKQSNRRILSISILDKDSDTLYMKMVKTQTGNGISSTVNFGRYDVVEASGKFSDAGFVTIDYFNETIRIRQLGFRRVTVTF